MFFNKINYENHKTKIMAENLNEIQDTLIKIQHVSKSIPLTPPQYQKLCVVPLLI